MVEIKIRDYEDYWGNLMVVGLGDNSQSIIVPKIERAVASGEKEIKVLLNTVGGKLFDGLAVRNALIRAKESGVKIITVNEGICASAGTLIYMAGDERVAYVSLLMIHKPQSFMIGSYNEDELKKEAEALRLCQEVILQVYAPTGLSEDVLNKMLNEETWLTPEMSVTLGFSTENRSNPEIKSDVLQSAYDLLMNGSATNKAFADRFFNTIPLKNMNVQDELKAVKENTAKNTTLLEEVKNLFGKLFNQKDGAEKPAEEEPELDADGNPIVKEEPIVEGPDKDAELEALKAENEELKTGVETANEALNKANEALTAIKNLKSTYKPADRTQNFNKPKAENSGVDLSPEAREARRAERKEIANKKNNK